MKNLFELEKSSEDRVCNTKTHLDINLEESKLNGKSNMVLDVLKYCKDN